MLAALTAAACTTFPVVPVPTLPANVHESAERYIVVTLRNPDPAPTARATSTPRGYDGGRLYRVNPVAQGTAKDIAHDFHLLEVSSWPIRALGVHCIVYRLSGADDLGATLTALGRDPRVESAEPLAIFSTLESRYNDTYRSLQHNFDALAAEGAHALSEGEGVRIALIDTGVDTRHPDLNARQLISRDFVNASAVPNAPERHGTEVAGVIAAITNNRLGIAGIAPKATLLSLKACWHPTPEAGAVCNSFTLAQALEAAIELRADVINLSLAGPADPLLERLVREAQKHGAIVVAAVAPGDPPGRFPARLPGVVAVDTVEEHNPRADVVLAPGHDIPTLVPDAAYDFASGSSLATAEVSGTVALLLAVHPHLSASAIRSLLLESAHPTAADSRGSVDACQALVQAEATGIGMGAQKNPCTSTNENRRFSESF